ncbi:MAG: hypothetical protein P9M03_08640 [Candidatus Theseobacter exili]|nr:hypothetical protein [Candidatus Theseobacter exili]
MLKKLLLVSAVLAVSLSLNGCDQNSGWSENWAGDLSNIVFSGNYYRVASPDNSITWLNLTQTYNVIQAVDNRGVRYTGQASNVRAVESAKTTVYGSETITIQGARPDSGATITMVLQAQIVAIMDPMYSNAAPESQFDVTITPADPAGQPLYAAPALRQTTTQSLATAVEIWALTGTYSDAAGLNGYIEFRLQTYDASDPTAIVNS